MEPNVPYSYILPPSLASLMDHLNLRPCSWHDAARGGNNIQVIPSTVDWTGGLYNESFSPGHHLKSSMMHDRAHVVMPPCLAWDLSCLPMITPHLGKWNNASWYPKFS